jgi:FkbM family methyltransferase
MARPPLSTSMGRAVGRKILRTWGKLQIASGYQALWVDRLGPALAEPEPLWAQLPNRCRIPCDLSDHIQRWIWFYGLYEPIEAFLFMRLLCPGMNVVDVGANAGQYTILASTCIGPAGQVHSFEPVPTTYTRLALAVAENHLTNVFLHRAALWSEETTLYLGLPPGFSENRDTGGFSVRAGDDRKTQIEAPALTLDTYVARENLTHIDFIKMDIEGAEPQALAGALETLKRFRPLLLLEINPPILTESGSSVAELWNLIAPLGYRVWRIGLDPSESGPLTSPEQVSGCCNVFLHHDDLPHDVTADWTFKETLRWARSGY